MSAIKFDYSAYKLFERPIIIDADAIESPETVTLRYEEAAARANGGDLRGDSPPGLLGIEACPKQEPPPMHSFESPQYSYAGQSFTSQQSDNAAAAQLNQLAFAANNSAASQYMSPVVPTLTSYQPTSGGFGTKIVIKISAPYDLISVASHFFLAFGSHKSPAHATRDTSDASGLGYVVSGDAPQLEDTRIPSGNVPISLLIESEDGQALGNIDVGTFTYHDGPAVGSEGSHGDITRRSSVKSAEEGQQHQHQQHTTSSLKHEHSGQQSQQQEADQLAEAAAANATNTYPYAPTTHPAVASNYDAAGYPSTSSNNMLSTYHRPSYGADYPRPPSLLKHSWSSHYGHSLASPRSSPTSIHHHHSTAVSRSGAAPLSVSASSEPILVRTSTIQPPGTSVSGLNPYALYSAKAALKINGDLESMANNWTPEECENGRRIVQFTKKQQGSTLSTTFKAISVNERPPNTICISCIYWAEKRECYVTSVDTISLLEQLVIAPGRFTVEEKNRIRRNLEGFRPLTVSKAKPDSEEFFKVIMSFPNPKPRNIEKDVKVFPWKILGPALKKIIGKYSVNPTGLNPSAIHHTTTYHPASGPPGPPALLTPVSSTSPGLYGPPHTPTIGDSSSYHHDSQTMASPRSLSGAPSSWGPYSAARTLSPTQIKSSPGGSVRIPLPSYSNYGLGRSWDTNGYSDASTTPTYASHQHSSQVYGGSTYGGSAHHRE
ncbi:hypothetical protein FHL15_005544 [Xylaria flabelliformis]|uniref:DUF7082 domain-containing protein n=1 Tax=Xylaria flabelliformis TaxID=2512241 RepID=A0A553I048_9PEZI|nr:hypothetical protein FHL15_005544 [Xylaria flabelliformis]